MAISYLRSGRNDDNGPGVAAQANLTGVPVKSSVKRGQSHNTGQRADAYYGVIMFMQMPER